MRFSFSSLVVEVDCVRVVNGERWSEAQRSAAMEDFKICEFGTLRITVMFFLVGLLTLLSTLYSLLDPLLFSQYK